MAELQRSSAELTQNNDIGTGPYLARIVSHLDPSFMGDIEVTLLRQQGNTNADENQTYTVHFASPFFGYTGFEFMGNNKADFNDTQKSYGLWMVPPDVGVTVLVAFVDGDPGQGYWFACVPPKFANNMVPAIGGTTEVELTDEDKKKYNTKMPLPVGEVNKRINGNPQGNDDTKLDAEKIKKPVHPIADAFLTQGLLEDDVRGVTTTTSRRETPSMVFGISSPGPLDRREGAKRAQIGKIQDSTVAPVPISRLGGTTIVMDDGDDRYHRKTPASTGPVEYVDLVNAKAGEKSEATIPYNEYFRIRTRTGHQLLMHNSEDLIYIGNSKGTAWIELTSNGKIDIYAADSISIHTEADLNVRADRDINLEAGRNINMKAETGRWQVEVNTDLNFLVANDAKLTVGGNYNLLVGSDTKISTVGTMNINSTGDNKISTAGTTHIGSGGDHVESAGTIYMNSSTTAAAAATADFVQPLDLKENISISPDVGWNPKKYIAGTTKSIMRRIPQHEPWPLHENMAPQLLTPDQTDREV